jgi:KEOPS complex subunit Cgi121
MMVKYMYLIFGARGKIENVDDFLKKIAKFSKKKNTVIQVFNADMIYDENHIISAYEHAKRAMIRKTNSTNTLEMEILLYSSGDRQLKKAILKMGVKKGNANIAFFIEEKSKDIEKHLLNELSLKRDDKVLKGDINTLKKFGITDDEISTVSKEKMGHIILEKIAFVDIIK